MPHKVSVVIPAYNSEKFLSRCLDSILNQSFQDFQIIIVDDASTDSVPQILESYAKKDSRITIITHTENKGICSTCNSALNYILNYAPTKWLTRVDSDDTLHPLFLEKLVNIAEEKNVDIVFCSRLNTIKENLPINFENKDFVPEIFTQIEDFWVDKMGCSAYSTGILFQSDLFTNIRFPQNRGIDDERTTYKLVFAAKQVAVIPTQLYNYFINNGSYMHSQYSVIKKADQLDSVYENFVYLYNHDYKKTFFKRFSDYLYLVCNTFLEYSDNPEFFDLIKDLKDKVIDLSIHYPDWMPYDKAKEIYTFQTKGVVKWTYNYNKNEEKGIKPKLRAIKWLIKAKHNIYHKNKIFTRKAKAKYLNSI